MKEKITVTKPFIPPKEEYDKYLNEIWENKWLTNNGPLHNQFEQELKKYLKINNIVLTVNGHSALDIAIKGLGLRGEVITTPFTFASTTHALTLNGITPIFCDIKESDMTIDETKIEGLITEKTTAIMPIHVYGHMCNIEKIAKIAKKHHLKVIYDASHTFGVKYKGESITNYGDASTLSFHATKIFNTIEGGAIVYKNKLYTKTFNTLKNFGIENQEEITCIGCNAKMNEFQAAMGLTNLNYIDDLIKERKQIAKIYIDELSKIDGIILFEPEKLYKNYEYNYSYFPIIIKSEKTKINRNELYDILKLHNIYTRKYFYPIVTNFECYKEKYSANVPIAERIGEEILCLPIYNGLSLKTTKEICDIIKKIIEEKKICPK